MTDDPFTAPEVDPYAPGQQWAGRGGAARMRLLVVGAEGNRMRVVRTCGASPVTLWRPFTITADQLEAAYQHDPRGGAYAALEPAEYSVVKRLVACEGATEPEGHPDDSVEAMAEEFEALVDRLTERYKAIPLDPPATLDDDQWRRVVVAHLRDDLENALDYVASRAGLQP